MHLLTQAKNNVSALELRRHLGVCYKTALTMKHKLMEVMRLREAPRQLDGRVEIDDAYLGGQRRGGKSGRGSENKVPFIAAGQTTPEGKPVLACFSHQPFTSEEVAIFAANSLSPSASVVSDGLWCFRGVTIIGAEHQPIVTGGGKASAQLPEFKAVNTVLSNLKTALTGTYHAFKFAKYAHRYLAEFQSASIAGMTWQLSSPASSAPPPSRPLSPRGSCSPLRFVANQEMTHQGSRNRRSRNSQRSPRSWALSQ